MAAGHHLLRLRQGVNIDGVLQGVYIVAGRAVPGLHLLQWVCAVIAGRNMPVAALERHEMRVQLPAFLIDEALPLVLRGLAPDVAARPERKGVRDVRRWRCAGTERRGGCLGSARRSEAARVKEYSGTLW